MPRRASRNFSRPSARRSGIALLGQLAFDHHLRGDAGMIGARLPKHAFAAHALETDENILQRIVERMADMQGARDVRRRDDDAETVLRIRFWLERARLFPSLAPARLHFLRVERGLDHRVQ